MSRLDQDQCERVIGACLGGLLTLADLSTVRAAVRKTAQSDEIWESWGKMIAGLEDPGPRLAEQAPQTHSLPAVEVPPAIDPPGSIVNPEMPLAVNRRPS